MKIGIVGAGCIGSSLARDIKSKDLGDVLVYDRNADYMAICPQPFVDECCDDLQILAAKSNLIFVCTPASIVPIIRDIAPGTIITDVGSVKLSILRALCLSSQIMCILFQPP